jgi:hypothetical protein
MKRHVLYMNVEDSYRHMYWIGGWFAKQNSIHDTRVYPFWRSKMCALSNRNNMNEKVQFIL